MANRVISGAEFGPIMLRPGDNLAIQASGSLTNLDSTQPAVTQDSFVVDIYGSVTSAGSGLSLSAIYTTTYIRPGGGVRASTNGIEFDATNKVPYFLNLGLVHGDRAGLVFEDNISSTDGSIGRWPYNGAVFNNGGEIEGGEFGIEFLKGGSITNHGTISGKFGIVAEQDLRLSNTGTIAGEQWSIFLHDATTYSTIVSSGTLIGDISLGAGNDLFDGSSGQHLAGNGSDTPSVFGLGGHDRLLGGNAAEHLDGGSGDDYLAGGGGDDVLIGGTGRDSLIGGYGRDLLVGGEGDDDYIFDGVDLIDESGGTVSDRDRVKSYVADLDVEANPLILGSIEDIWLQDGAANAAGNAVANWMMGNDADNHLIGRGGDDLIYGGVGNDILDGGFDDDILFGGTGKDTLIGASGADVLDGGAGADALRGGSGNDVYFVDTNADVVDELADGGSGVDTVRAFVPFDLGGPAVKGTVENLILGGSSNLNGFGNGADNSLIGNSGSNVLSGKGGNDFLNGGLGNDQLTGGAGADTFVFSTALSAQNHDLITDFEVGRDIIRLENSIFSSLGAAGRLSSDQFAANLTGQAEGKADRIVYEVDTGRVFYDSNGSEPGGTIEFARLKPGLALTHADFFIV